MMGSSVFERSHFGHHYIFEFLNTTQPCSIKILLANDTYGKQITHNKRHAAIFTKVDIFLMYQVTLQWNLQTPQSSMIFVASKHSQSFFGTECIFSS